MLPLRLAIIGLGAVTQDIHLPAYKQLETQVTLVGGCDVNPAARAALQDHVPVFEEAEAMLDHTHPDIVAICTPPALHRAQCLLALARGCHVFCEKPFAPSMEDAAVIVQAAARAKRHVVVNAQFPFMSIYQAAKAQIDTSGFGRLLFMHAWQTFQRTAQTESGWRGEMERRLCLEFGVHVFELVRFFFDDMPETLMAHMPRPLPEEKADVVNTIALGFKDGRGAAIVLNRLNRGPHRYLEMHLDGEYRTIRTSIGGEARIEVGLRPASRRPFWDVHFAKGGKAVQYHGDTSHVLAREGLNPFATATARHLRQFVEAIVQGTEPLTTGQDHLHTLALALAAYESAASQQVVLMPAYLQEQLATLKLA